MFGSHQLNIPFILFLEDINMKPPAYKEVETVEKMEKKEKEEMEKEVKIVHQDHSWRDGRTSRELEAELAYQDECHPCESCKLCVVS